MIWRVLQTRRFSRVYKKLHDNLVQDVDDAVAAIAANPDIGEKKKGDLASLYVYAGSTSKCNTRCLTISVFQKGCIGGFEPQALSWPPV